jgi:hypothetical protein
MIVFISISFPLKDCQGWWFNKSYKQWVAEALRSKNPRKVEKGLDKSIQKNDYSGILQIRNHARKMIRLERNDLIKSKILSPERVQKKISPWVKIDKKATQFFQKKFVRQENKNHLNSLYHR